VTGGVIVDDNTDIITACTGTTPPKDFRASTSVWIQESDEHELRFGGASSGSRHRERFVDPNNDNPLG